MTSTSPGQQGYRATSAMKTTARCLVCWSVILMLGCGSKPHPRPVAAHVPRNAQEARQVVKEQAEELAVTVREADHERTADLTLQALMDKFGGRANYIQKLKSIAEDFKSQGIHLKSTVMEPTQVVEVGSTAYAIVPQEAILTRADGTTIRKRSYLVGYSEDRGASWTFVDGAGIHGNRKVLKQLLPNWPDQLKLPADEPTATE